ncbi:MAG: hypothetical protein ACRD50_16335 [Candidatus Acidiferrales bacterium]
MTSWAREQAKKSKQAEAKREELREWAVYQAREFPAKARRLWERLAGEINRNVDEFNEEFSADESKQFLFANHSLEIIIRRTYMPEVRVIVNFNETSKSVDFERAITRASYAEPHPAVGSFFFHFAETGDLYLTDRAATIVSCEEVAHAILEPIFKL